MHEEDEHCFFWLICSRKTAGIHAGKKLYTENVTESGIISIFLFIPLQILVKVYLSQKQIKIHQVYSNRDHPKYRLVVSICGNSCQHSCFQNICPPIWDGASCVPPTPESETAVFPCMRIFNYQLYDVSCRLKYFLLINLVIVLMLS